jgi:hypothetical protein
MAKRNQAHMEALEKERPSPTIAEIQKALTPRPVRQTVSQDYIPEYSKPPEDDKVEKASTPDKSPGGNYKTRDMNAKK